MIVCEDRSGKTISWAAAIDEGYEPNPHIELSIFIRGVGTRWKIPMAAERDCEATQVVKLLREIAAQMESTIKAIRARAPTKEGEPECLMLR